MWTRRIALPETVLRDRSFPGALSEQRDVIQLQIEGKANVLDKKIY